MSFDPDFLLLDRVFQPVVDRAAGVASCFALARASMIGVIVLHTMVLAWDLNLMQTSLERAIVVAGTLMAYGAAAQLKAQIDRGERQSRPGTMNLRRITLRSFRFSWLALASLSAWMLSASELRPVDLCCFLAGLGWVASVYFASCAEAPPPRRVHSLLPCFGGAR